jgi:hypothetical protein
MAASSVITMRLTLWLSILLTTFTLAVTAAMLYLSRPTPNNLESAVLKHEAQAAPVAPSCYPGLSRKVEKFSKSSLFPPGAFYPNPEHEGFVVEWYAKHLQAMHEQSLLSYPESQTESYRFLWLRTFHRPVAVRVWHSEEGSFLNVKQLSGAGGYEAGKLITNQTRQLTNAEWDGFVSLLDRSCYWQLPAKNDDEMGKDGAQWILEGTRQGRYHVVDRWTPRSGDFREACLYLLKLSNLGIDLSSEDVY